MSLVLLGLALGLIPVELMVPASAQNTDVAVVVNPDNPVAGLTLVDLRKIFAGEKRSWPGGLPIKLVVRAPGCHERLALLRLLNMSESEYKQYWTAQVLRGEASSEPVAVFSNGFQKEAIRALPGGIALVDAQDAKSVAKVVKLDGHLPGEAGYPLH
jgi:ABC-type phosphate transport system substrate-binding protein